MTVMGEREGVGQCTATPGDAVDPELATDARGEQGQVSAHGESAEKSQFPPLGGDDWSNCLEERTDALEILISSGGPVDDKTAIGALGVWVAELLVFTNRRIKAALLLLLKAVALLESGQSLLRLSTQLISDATQLVSKFPHSWKFDKSTAEAHAVVVTLRASGVYAGSCALGEELAEHLEFDRAMNQGL
jgi:hypothetical protein